MKKLLNFSYLFVFIISSLTWSMNKGKIYFDVNPEEKKVMLVTGNLVGAQPQNFIVGSEKPGIAIVNKRIIRDYEVKEQKVDWKPGSLNPDIILNLVNTSFWKIRNLKITTKLGNNLKFLETDRYEETSCYTPQAKGIIGGGIGLGFAGLATLIYWWHDKK